jgi:hypothetical protein
VATEGKPQLPEPGALVHAGEDAVTHHDAVGDHHGLDVAAPRPMHTASMIGFKGSQQGSMTWRRSIKTASA